MKKALILSILALCVSFTSVNAISLWTDLGGNDRAYGMYTDLGDSGLYLGGWITPTIDTDNNSYSGWVSLDGIPVMGGIEVAAFFANGLTDKDGASTMIDSIVIGKGFLYDLTDELSVGFYVEALKYQMAGATSGSIILFEKLYPVITADIELF